MVGITLTDNEYGVHLAKTLNLLRIEQKWTDCCLETRTGKVHVHHVVLAAVVEKLQITSLILSGSKQTFLLKDFNVHIVEIFITYLYTGNLKLSSEIDIREFVKLCKHLEFSTLLSHNQFQKYLVSLNDNDTELNDSEIDNKSEDVPYPIYLTSNRSLLVSTDQIIDNAAQVIKSSLPHSVSTTSHVGEPVQVALPHSISTKSHVSEPVQITLPHSVSTISSVGEQVPSSSKNMDSEKITESTEQSSEVEMQIKQEIVFEEDFSFTSYMNTCSEQTLDTLMTSVSSVDKQNTHKSTNELNLGKSKNTAKQLSSFKAKKGNIGMKICEKNKGRKNISSSVSNPSAHKYAEELVSVPIGADETKLDQEEVESIVPTDEVKVEQESDLNSENITIMDIDGTIGTREHTSDEITQKEVKDQKSYKCKTCKYTTVHRSAICRHRRYCEKNLAHACQHCQRKFPDMYELKRHQKEKHIDGLLCSHCCKRFTSRQGLRYHLRSIRGEFKYRCEECDTTFLSKQHYDGHMNTHRNHKPFTCKVCKKSFAYKSVLEQHIGGCHTKTEYKCSECEMVFFSNATLRNHREGKHGNKVYRCETCGKLYRWAASYYTHRKTHIK